MEDKISKFFHFINTLDVTLDDFLVELAEDFRQQGKTENGDRMAQAALFNTSRHLHDAATSYYASVRP